jgi:streptogramin lyase
VKTFSISDPETGPTAFGPLFLDRKGIIYVEGWNKGFITFNVSNGKFKVYKHDPSDPTSVRQESALGFIETDNGLIWFCTHGGGVGVFDPNTEKFKAFTTESGLIDNNLVSMVKDLKGRIWAGSYEGLSCFTPPDDPFVKDCRINFRNYDASDGLPSNVF